MYPKFTKKHKSLMAKYLTEEIYNKLKNKKIKNGFTIDMAINSGVKNPDSGIGVYAGDKESYSLFGLLFDPIIQEYHDFGEKDKHKSNLDTRVLKMKNLDKEGKYILSTRIRVGRNIKGMPLGTAISNKNRKVVEKSVSKALKGFSGELKGKYYSLEKLTKSQKESLIKDHFLFKQGDRFLQSAGLNNDWPKNRGIFHNNKKTFLVWINEEDQLRIISMQKGGNIKEVFKRLVKALDKIETKVAFSYDKRLGYITSCPTNLGTALRASVHIKLPRLAKDMKSFEKICKKYHLQIRGVDGEHSKSKGGIFDISNKRRLGISEIECINDMYNGVATLIEKEKEMSKK